MSPSSSSEPLRVFITGGASGFGRALAERYARAGARVCIGDIHDARGAETLDSLKAHALEAKYQHCDVTQESDLIAVRDELIATWGGVDVVINNAGVALAGSIDETSLEDWDWIVDINLLGVVRGCRVFTPVFKQQKSGYFVNVSSMAGLLDVPRMSAYNATKAAVVSLSETLQNELSEHGIGITLVCPSFFQTNLGESMRTSDPMLQRRMEQMLARSPLTAADIADKVFAAVQKREFYLLPHAAGHSTWLLKRFAPRRAYRNIVLQGMRKMFRKREPSKH